MNRSDCISDTSALTYVSWFTDCIFPPSVYPLEMGRGSGLQDIRLVLILLALAALAFVCTSSLDLIGRFLPNQHECIISISEKKKLIIGSGDLTT